MIQEDGMAESEGWARGQMEKKASDSKAPWAGGIDV
jgi:hypothetical protein